MSQNEIKSYAGTSPTITCTNITNKEHKSELGSPFGVGILLHAFKNVAINNTNLRHLESLNLDLTSSQNCKMII